MRQGSYKGPKLPKSLLDQFGPDRSNDRKSTHRSNGLGTRKVRRKAEREQKKAPEVNKRRSGGDLAAQKKDVSTEESKNHAQRAKVPAQSAPLKSILKRPPQNEEGFNAQIYSSTGGVSRKRPREEKKRLDRDDEEIAELEKKLGLIGRKSLPTSYGDDVFESVLDGLDDGGIGGTKRARAGDDEWLRSKRRKTGHGPAEVTNGQGDEELSEHSDDSSNDAENFQSDEAAFSDEDLEDDPIGLEDEKDKEDEEELFDGFESDAPNATPQRPARENPYVAPGASGSQPSSKYVPPSLRTRSASDVESFSKLRRQVQGLLNRLSEANLISILGEVENLYQTNPRGHVTDTLIELLLALISDKASLMDTFLILHAGFIAAIYKIIGPDFGAQLVERLVEEVLEHYGPSTTGNDPEKKIINLVSLLAGLYNFQVIGSNLVFDLVRLFLESLSDVNTELLLRVVQTSGPQLRADDPTAVKSIVQLLQDLVAKADQTTLPVRTKFMLETITNLKNNRMKNGAAASAITSEHIIRMKKTLGSLNVRNLRAAEPLRVGLADLKNKEKRGKWWVVGASFRDANTAPRLIGLHEHRPTNPPIPADDLLEPDTDASGAGAATADLHALAVRNRMNTPVRLQIFLAIMSATDYKDAHLRLTKLRLKRAQELEIPKVLLHCAGMETGYNPYYTLIARKLCGDRRLRMGFQFGLWDVFRRMGERGDAFGDDDEVDDEDEEHGGRGMGTRKIVNLARMYGNLIVEGALGLSVLKVLHFPYVQPKTKTFLEILFITIVLQSQKRKSTISEKDRDEKALLDVIMRAQDAPQMARGLQYFLKSVVAKTDIPAGTEQKETVKWGCKVARQALEAIAGTTVKVD